MSDNEPSGEFRALEYSADALWFARQIGALWGHDLHEWRLAWGPTPHAVRRILAMSDERLDSSTTRRTQY
jgi:hypothetical protein